MTSFSLLLLCLACYIVTDALVNRALPFGIMTRIRERFNWQLFHCMYCAGWWVAIGLYLIYPYAPQVIEALAVGGGMLLLWRYSGGVHT